MVHLSLTAKAYHFQSSYNLGVTLSASNRRSSFPNMRPMQIFISITSMLDNKHARPFMATHQT